MIPFATNDEIKKAHEILLSGSPEFEPDKIAVIQNNESRDIKACPGSGKTTVLLAKLCILSNRMPFVDGKGVCILTHTNVAIDEIKARFGGKANLLFSYPNFCGTIQSFVDTFLTIPCFNSFSHHPLVTIDDERAISIIKNTFYNSNREEQKTLNHLFYDNDAFKKACEEKRWGDVVKMKLDLLSAVFVELCPERYYKEYGSKTPIAACNSKNPSPTYKFLNKTRLSAFREGVLKFEDAYSVGLAYIAMIPGLKDSMSKRFKYVFIDEVQDSNQLQLDLLNKIFDDKSIIVQRFGDSCQAIYNNDGVCAWIPQNPLPLNQSKRFGESIAKILRTVCIENNNDLEGNEDIPSVNH